MQRLLKEFHDSISRASVRAVLVRPAHLSRLAGDYYGTVRLWCRRQSEDAAPRLLGEIQLDALVVFRPKKKGVDRRIHANRKPAMCF